MEDSALDGFLLEGDTEKLVTTLFADDTTVYLTEEDDYSYLIEILNTWCRVSGAKFNEQKTVLIPIGTREYRHGLLTSRKLKEGGESIPDGCAIAADGTPVRVLGAYVGNNVSNAEVWTPTLEKITLKLVRWSKGHPTQDGRQKIVGMDVGGMTQYLTKVQGMSPEVEEEVTKQIRNFMWDDKSPMVGMETLCAPIAEGGKGLLDIRARNEAIELMKVKTYLSKPEDRPRWAFVADRLIAQSSPVSQNVSDNLKTNPFLQSWSPGLTARSALPDSLKKMLSVAKKYNVTLDPPLVDVKLRREMPAWYTIKGLG
ncbi:hypothetical protein CPC08DRAFT_738004 [Agrocybe pediades]|nr:hypothetical protein CPC08DRAFT_738004 [Agrocybe pediades]